MGLSKEGKELLEQGACHMGVPLTPVAIEALSSYLNAIEETNRHTNLTRIIGDAAAAGHFLDALSICQVFDLSRIKTLIDVGTGLGVPGLVLKIAFPHIEVLLLDSLQKRISFLNTCIVNFSLHGVAAVHGRAEDLGRMPSYREKFNVCISRAVAPLKLLSELCAPFVATGGTFAAYKGNIDEHEMLEAEPHMKTLGLSTPDIKPVDVYGLSASRVIILSSKSGHTPAGYPRSSKVLARKD